MPANRYTKKLGTNRRLTIAERAEIVANATQSDPISPNEVRRTNSLGRRSSYIITGDASVLEPQGSDDGPVPGVKHFDRAPK